MIRTIKFLSTTGNMVSLKFRGPMAAPFQAFKKDMSLDLDNVLTHAKFFADNGVKGILVNGTNGEGPALSVAERKTVLEKWLAVAKETQQHIMTQICGCPLPDVLELAKHAEKVGAGSILCLPELYYRPANLEALIEYLKLISQAAPNTPLVYYHNPTQSGVSNISMEKFIPEAAKHVPTFQGIKYGSNDLDGGLAALQAAENGKYVVFIASANLIASAYLMGFDSCSVGILNIFPKLVVDIVNAAKATNIQEAKELQERLRTYSDAILKHGNRIPSLKLAMKLLTPVDVGPARPPHVNLTPDHVDAIKKELKDLSLI